MFNLSLTKDAFLVLHRIAELAENTTTHCSLFKNQEVTNCCNIVCYCSFSYLRFTTPLLRVPVRASFILFCDFYFHNTTFEKQSWQWQRIKCLFPLGLNCYQFTCLEFNSQIGIGLYLQLLLQVCCWFLLVSWTNCGLDGGIYGHWESFPNILIILFFLAIYQR